MSEYNMSHTGAQLDSAINKVNSGYILPSGNKSITANGTHDVKNYENAVVDVPVPDGYVIPSGSVNITTNGSHSVSGKATANVNVPNTLVTARERQTPTSNVRTLTFNIDLNGATPNVIFVFAENLTSLNSTDTLIDACYDESEGFILSKYSSAASTLANTGSSNIEFDVSTIGKIKVTVSNSYFRSGVQYYCRAWA